MCGCGCVYVNVGVLGSQKRAWDPLELPDMGVGNQTLFLCRAFMLFIRSGSCEAQTVGKPAAQPRVIFELYHTWFVWRSAWNQVPFLCMPGMPSANRGAASASASGFIF